MPTAPAFRQPAVHDSYTKKWKNKQAHFAKQRLHINVVIAFIVTYLKPLCIQLLKVILQIRQNLTVYQDIWHYAYPDLKVDLCIKHYSLGQYLW